MSNVQVKPALLAEMLVARVLGDTGAFAQFCARQGISVEAAVHTALSEFMARNSTTVETQPGVNLLHPHVAQLPDPADCPQGQEQHYLEMCDHDIEVLRKAQSRYAVNKDALNLKRVTRTLEAYLQARASLKERLECG